MGPIAALSQATDWGRGCAGRLEPGMVRVVPPPGLHAAAADWHRVLLGGIALVAACLMQPRPDLGGPLPTAMPPADRVVLVIVDGLRVDEAASREQMPFTAAVATRAVARVECELPSSIAAIETWTSGRVPTLRSFLGDFSTAPQARGGLLERLHATGRPAFVSGPTLWTGRFGPWIDGVGDDSWGVADASRASHVLDALRTGRGGLLIVHFDQLDRAGHRGGDVDAALQTTDDFIRTIAEATTAEATTAGAATAEATTAGAGTCRDVLLITSDHGRTASGGHAGLEPEVLQTPLLAIGCDLPPELTQRQTGDLLADLTGVARSQPADEGRPFAGVVFAVAALSASVLWLEADRRPTPKQAAGLGVGSLLAFAALLLGSFIAAIGIAAVVAIVRRGRPEVSRWIGAGVAVAAARFALPTLVEPSMLKFAIGTGLAVVVTLALPRRVAVLGVLLIPVLQMQTASLSSIQTGPGFALMERSGPAAGVALTVLLHAAPWLLLGWRSFSDWPRWRSLLGAALLTTAAMRLLDPAATPLLVRLVCEVAMLGLGGGAAWLSRSTLWVAPPVRRLPSAGSKVPAA